MKAARVSFYNAITRLRADNWRDLLRQMHNPEQKNQVQWKIFRRTLGANRNQDVSQIKDAHDIEPGNMKESLDNLARFFADVATQQAVPVSDALSMVADYSARSFREALQHDPRHSWFQSAPLFRSQNDNPIVFDDVKKRQRIAGSNFTLDWMTCCARTTSCNLWTAVSPRMSG